MPWPSPFGPRTVSTDHVFAWYYFPYFLSPVSPHFPATFLLLPSEKFFPRQIAPMNPSKRMLDGVDDYRLDKSRAGARTVNGNVQSMVLHGTKAFGYTATPEEGGKEKPSRDVFWVNVES